MQDMSTQNAAPLAEASSSQAPMQTTSANMLQVIAYAKVDATQAWLEGHTGIPVLVRVSAPREISDRIPIDVVAVLDASVNRMSLLNTAMDFVIKKLNSQDRLAIIATPKIGEDDSLLAMTSDGQKKAMSRVQEIAACGDNKLLLKTLNKAAAILDGRTEEERNKKEGFILLISDGEDSSICLETLNPMYPVHALGFRDTQNARQMHHVARSSSGTYCILNDEHGQITEAFKASIGNITSIVAVRSKIYMDYTGQDAATVISAIESGTFRNNIVNNHKTGCINVGTLQAGAARSFIVYTNVEEKEQDELSKRLTVRVESYAGSRAREMKEAGEVVVARKGGDGSRKVAAEMVRVKAVEIVGSILDRYNRNGHDSSAADELRDKWVGVMNTEYGREAAGEAWLTAGLAAEMKEMEAAMRQDSGLSYMVSWHTRQTLQHLPLLPEAKGFPSPPARVVSAGGRALLDTPDATSIGKRKREHCTEMEVIERRMAYWSTVLCGLPPMHRGDCPGHAAIISQEVSRKSILQAMYKDVFLAVAMNVTDRSGSKSTECPCCCLGTANKRLLD